MGFSPRLQGSEWDLSPKLWLSTAFRENCSRRSLILGRIRVAGLIHCLRRYKESLENHRNARVS